MDCLLSHGGRWKIKSDIICWICDDLEKLTVVDEWPKFNEFVQRLPSMFSALLDETNRNSASDSASFSTPFELLLRLEKILLLRAKSLPLQASIVERVIETELLRLLLSNIQQAPSPFRKEVVNLLYYAVPLKEPVVESILSVMQGKECGDLESLKTLLA